jgi:hypothetical protein
MLPELGDPEAIVMETISEEEELAGGEEEELDCEGDGGAVVGFAEAEGVEEGEEVADGVTVGVTANVGETVGDGETEATVFSGEEY